MNKKTVLFIVGAIVLVAGFLWATKPAPDSQDSAATAKPTEHIAGKGTTGVTLVEYGDFQCPACGAYYPVVKEVKEFYGDKIKFQFRNNPLESLHKNARAGARAAEAAALQGKYWEMHDKLFENQQSWENASDPLSFYKQYAQAVGVKDLVKFESDYKSADVNNKINADLQEGRALGVNSTPTFFLNGKLIDNPNSADAFKQVVDAEIAKKAKN